MTPCTLLILLLSCDMYRFREKNAQITRNKVYGCGYTYSLICAQIWAGLECHNESMTKLFANNFSRILYYKVNSIFNQWLTICWAIFGLHFHDPLMLHARSPIIKLHINYYAFNEFWDLYLIGNLDLKRFQNTPFFSPFY